MGGQFFMTQRGQFRMAFDSGLLFGAHDRCLDPAAGDAEATATTASRRSMLLRPSLETQAAPGFLAPDPPDVIDEVAVGRMSAHWTKTAGQIWQNEAKFFNGVRCAGNPANRLTSVYVDAVQHRSKGV